MDILILPRQRKLIASLIRKHGYYSASVVVAEAIDALDFLLQDAPSRKAWLKFSIQKGLDQFARGEYTQYDDKSLKELFEKIKRNGRRELAAEKRRRVAKLRRELQLGIDELDRGKSVPLDIAAMKADLRKRLARGNRPR